MFFFSALYHKTVYFSTYTPCKPPYSRCVELCKYWTVLTKIVFFGFDTMRRRDCFATLQNLPDGKPALFRLFAAVRTPVPVSKFYFVRLGIRSGKPYAAIVTILVHCRFQNLLLVGPGVLIFRDYTKTKNDHKGRLLFW